MIGPFAPGSLRGEHKRSTKNCARVTRCRETFVEMRVTKKGVSTFVAATAHRIAFVAGAANGRGNGQVRYVTGIGRKRERIDRTRSYPDSALKMFGMRAFFRADHAARPRGAQMRFA